MADELTAQLNAARDMLAARYAEGYKAGRIAALREAIALCERHEDMMGAAEGEMRRLLAEAESGEQEREVGGEG